MMYKRISFIGGGRITQIFLKGLKCKNTLPEKVMVIDPDTETHKQLKNLKIPGLEVYEKNICYDNAELIFLAVHPPVIKEILPEIKNQFNAKLILVSLAPVVKISALQQLLGGFDRILRMIPNAPSVIGKGYNPVCFANSISLSEKKELLTLFNDWGETPEVDEDRLEAYAILTAMGPTYFWFQWQELQRLGEAFNVTNKEIRHALHQMISGASQLFFQSGIADNEVMDMIPVRPLRDDEENIREIIRTKLTGLHTKLIGRS